MRSPDPDFSRSPAEFFAARNKPSVASGEPSRGAMLRQILFNSTDSSDLDLVLVAHGTTDAPASMNGSHGGSLSVAALLRPGAGRGGAGLREGELHKPDLVTYIVMCLLLFLLVLLIVFFINCQLRNSFFASMPYDRSLREARTSYK
ncbi:small integral membrane protein 32-like [Cololabis saira]|uniref:small integral membrane protein 32-like n=1 Tax=Cololabis saira TaxID=129043 RepID=UPI002AD4BA95|nr:small integral membrane protein 32-like [Cololabis saira]